VTHPNLSLVSGPPDYQDRQGRSTDPAGAFSEALLDVQRLRLEYVSATGKRSVAISEATLRVGGREIVGICGPSGSGKTSFALALLNLLPRTAVRSADALRFCGVDMLKLNEGQMRRVRGKLISIIYQEPALALNPLMTVADQLGEVIRAHEHISKKDRRQLVWKLLRTVRLDSRPGICQAFPHQLSGGERHRVVIAQALACSPSLIIADEPTAGLDGELTAEILELIARLRLELNISFLFITHNPKILARLADRTFEMVNGRLQGSKASAEPTHSTLCPEPSRTDPASGPAVIVRDLWKSYDNSTGPMRSASLSPVLRGVNLIVPLGSAVGLVGPSGSGKSTLAKCLALWERPDSGEIIFNGQDITRLSAAEARRARPRMQLVLQDSAAGFNPNLTVEEIIEEPLVLQGIGKHKRKAEVIRLVEQTGLGEDVLTNRAFELSGGQRQRLAIARALILNPELIIFDESTAGLDVSTQRQIISLIQELRRHQMLTYVFISHDRELVESIADRIVTMRNGELVENGREAQSFASPGQVSKPELPKTRTGEIAVAGENG